MQNNLPTIATHVHHSVCNPKDEYNKKAQSKILLSTTKLNNLIGQIMAKHLESSREVMV